MDSAANIRMVDDKSLDSASDNTSDYEQHRRRNIKPRKKDVQTNTDQVFDTEQLQQSFFEDRGKILVIFQQHSSFQSDISSRIKFSKTTQSD